MNLFKNILFQPFIYIIKTLYSFYNLLKIKNILNSKIRIPIKIRNFGHIYISGKCFLNNCSIIVEKNATLFISNNVNISPFVNLHISKAVEVFIHEGVKIEKSNIKFTQKSYIGKNVVIASGVDIYSRENESGMFEIGEGSRIGNNSIIDLTSNVKIGKNVAIGPNCIIYSHDHDYQNTKLPAWKGNLIKGDVIIEDGAWIGSGVILLPGIKIGKNSVIGAGAVVTKDVLPFTLNAGVPSRIIKEIN